MKDQWKGLAALSLATLSGLCFVIVLSAVLRQNAAAAQVPSPQTNSYRAFSKVLRRPTTAEDHSRVAAYYRNQAARLRQKIALDERYIADYESKRLYPTRFNYPHGNKLSCKLDASRLDAEAQEVESLAEKHELFAAQLRDRTSAPVSNVTTPF